MALDLLLLISLLVSSMSAIDFLLRPKQRFQIQSLLEDLTLRTDQLEASDLAVRLNEKGVQALIVLLTYVELAMLLAISIFFQLLISRLFHINPLGAGARRFQFIGVVITAITLFLAWHWPLPRMMKWVLGNGKRKAIIFRLVAIVVVFYTLSFLYDYAVDVVFLDSMYPLRNSPEALLAHFYSTLPFLPVFVVFWVVIQGAGMCLWPNGIGIRLFLNLSKGILWRVVEYERGAVAAIAILVTVLLTILKVLVG
jgi:hypothetical protein